MTSASAPVKASTQTFVEVYDIKDDIAILTNGYACIVIESGSVNYPLLGVDEQLALVSNYAALLNSLSFPIEIVINSKKKNIANYLGYLDKKIIDQTNPILKNEMLAYKQFVSSLVTKNVILEKRFFFVIQFNPESLGLSSNTKMHSDSPEYLVSIQKDLYPKRDHLIRQLKSLGLLAKTLSSKELVEVYFSSFNPNSPLQKITSLFPSHS